VTLFCGTTFTCQREPPLHKKFEPALHENTGFWYELLKIRRTAFGTLALFTFSDILELTAFKQGLHFDFPAAGTKEFLGSAGCTGVFTGLPHGYTPCQNMAFFDRGLSINPLKLLSYDTIDRGNCQYGVRGYMPQN
jgi:hypothetical protein